MVIRLWPWLILGFLGAGSAGALEIAAPGLSGEPMPFGFHVSREELRSISRPRPFSGGPFPEGGRIEESVALEEILPVCRSLRSLRTVGPGSGVVWGGQYPPAGTRAGNRAGSPAENPSENRLNVETLYRTYLLLGPDGENAGGSAGPRRGNPQAGNPQAGNPQAGLTLVQTDALGQVLQVAEGVEGLRIEAEPAAPGELEVWVGWEGVPLIKEEIRRWGRLHGRKVTVTHVPKGDSKMLSVLRGGGRPPDIILIQSDYLPPLIGARAVQPMVRFPAGGFAEKGLEAFRREEQLWAVPFYCDAQMLFYRRDLLDLPEGEAAGGPGWTWASFEEKAAAVPRNHPGVSPASWNAYSAYWLIPLLRGFGKDPLLEPDGALRVDDAPTREAVEWLKGMMDRGILDLRERDSMFSRFVSGDTAVMLSASFSLPELERLGVPFGIAPLPRGPAGPSSPLLDFKGWAVSRKTRHPRLARRLLLSLSDPAVQHRFTRRAAKLPVTRASWRLAEEENPYAGSLRAAYRRGIPVPSSRGYRITKNTLWKMLRLMLTGRLAVDAGLKKAQDMVDARSRNGDRAGGPGSS